MDKINIKSNKIMNLVSAVNVTSAIIIGSIIKTVLVKNELINPLISKYFIISGIISILIVFLSALNKNHKVKKINKEIMNKNNESKISLITDLNNISKKTKLNKSTTFIVTIITIILQFIAGTIVYTNAKNIQKEFITERKNKIQEIENILNKEEDIFKVDFLDENSYNSIYITKKLSNYNETIQIRLGFDENNKLISYPASINGYYATKNIDIGWLIGTVITFMEDMTKIPDIDEELYRALMFDPTNTQIELLEEHLEKGIDNSDNIVYSEEPVMHDGKECRVRFRYNIDKDNSIFEGSDELDIQYILGSDK